MGVHVARHARTSAPLSSLLLLALVSIHLSFVGVVFGASPPSEADGLLKFRDSMNKTSALSGWSASLKICADDVANWKGVLCLKGIVWGLKLENLGLAGSPNLEALDSLPNLRTISLMNNNLEGPLPSIKKLRVLKSLYLTNNRFSGSIPDDAFSGMNSLKKIYLGNNGLTGKIPSSLSTLPNLSDLRLQGNQFQGGIPEFLQSQRDIKIINLSNNELEGPIPESLQKMDPSSFTGNKNLCGPPLGECKASNDASSGDEGSGDKDGSIAASASTGSEKQVSVLKIALIVLVVGILLGIIAALLILFYWKKRNSRVERDSSALEDTNTMPTTYVAEKKAPVVVETEGTKKRGEYGKLSFVRDDIERFDLQDMLTSAAEVLGSGTFGASYKTVISSGRNLVVKRYKQMNNVGREFFIEHMRRIGRLQHPNLLSLVAFYYRKEEKLLVTEFAEKTSLASLIHGNHTQGLDWQTRLKIIKGVVKGLAYLHKELPSIVLPHGHLKSSNVLLDNSFEPLLSDYALRPVINPDQAHLLLVAYKSPEYAKTGKITKKADIWSLGILILELLTGKFPENYLTPGYDSKTSISTWVNEMVKEKRTSEVFDEDMGGAKNSKSEMINLLKIGLSCCEEDVDSRMELKDVVEKIEQLKEGDHDDDQEHLSEGYAFSSIGTEDEYSFSRNG